MLKMIGKQKSLVFENLQALEHRGVVSVAFAMASNPLGISREGGGIKHGVKVMLEPLPLVCRPIRMLLAHLIQGCTHSFFAMQGAFNHVDAQDFRCPGILSKSLAIGGD